MAKTISTIAERNIAAEDDILSISESESERVTSLLAYFQRHKERERERERGKDNLSISLACNYTLSF